MSAALLLSLLVLRNGTLVDRLLIVAPAAPGGGWDQTARAMQHALEREGLVRTVEVQNVAGAAGAIGLAQFIDTQRHNENALLVTGLVMLGATIWNDSPVSLGQVTPIARLTAEYEVIAVPAASRYRNMRDVVEALQTSPGQVSWGGGSAGGTDHILAGLVAAAARIDPRRVNYIAFSGGGEAVAALVGSNVTAGVSGYSEFAPHIQSGRIRALAVSAPARVPGVEVPTLREQGLDIDLANWRGIVAPDGISDEARRRLSEVIVRMVRSNTWRQTLADREWTDAHQDAEAFGRFLDTERIRVTRIVSRLRAPGGEASRMGHRAFPTFVFGGAAMIALMLMRQRPRQLPTQARSSTRSVGIVFGALLTFVVLLAPLGFIVAGSVMFAVVASAFGPGRAGSSRPIVTLVIALVLSLVVYIAFTRGLGLALPPGAIWSWMR